MNWFKKIFKELNKKGVSATVIGIILLVVGLALVVLLVVFMGQESQTSVSDMIINLNKVKHGGA